MAQQSFRNRAAVCLYTPNPKADLSIRSLKSTQDPAGADHSQARSATRPGIPRPRSQAGRFPPQIPRYAHSGKITGCGSLEEKPRIVRTAHPTNRWDEPSNPSPSLPRGFKARRGRSAQLGRKAAREAAPCDLGCPVKGMPVKGIQALTKDNQQQHGVRRADFLVRPGTRRT
jgi:hypothetical protein